MSKVLKCPICGTIKIAQRKDLTCSRICGAAYSKQRHPHVFQERARKAVQAAARARKARRPTQYADRYPGVPTEAVRAIRMAGYQAGHKRGTYQGFRKGLEEGRKLGHAQGFTEGHRIGWAEALREDIA